MPFRVLATARSFCHSNGPHYDILRENDCLAELPPPAGHPLLTLGNFLPTLHITGTIVESVQRMTILAAQNVVDVLHGEPCGYVVNTDVCGPGRRT